MRLSAVSRNQARKRVYSVDYDAGLFSVFAVDCSRLVDGAWTAVQPMGRVLTLGTCGKNMFELDALYTIPESNDGFKDYPPALALLQYLFMKTVGQGFREDIAIFSLGFLTVGMLLYPVSRFSWKNWFWCGLYAGFMFILPASYLGDYYVNTMADGLLGTLFAFLCCWRTSQVEQVDIEVLL